MVHFLKLLSFLSLSISLCLSDDLPSYFPRCHIDDPELEKCFLKATETMRPYLKKGIPELDIPPVEPLIIPEIVMEQGTNAVNYKLTLTNATIKGMSEYVFETYKYDPKTLIYRGTALFNGISLLSNYDIDGKILLAPITGKGILNIKLGPSTGSLIVTGELDKRNGEEYYKIKDVISVINITDASGNFEGLFNNNKELSDATNRLLNDNAAELIKETKPALEEVASNLIRRLMEGVCNKIPYTKLFPPSHQ